MNILNINYFIHLQRNYVPQIDLIYIGYIPFLHISMDEYRTYVNVFGEHKWSPCIIYVFLSPAVQTALFWHFSIVSTLSVCCRNLFEFKKKNKEAKEQTWNMRKPSLNLLHHFDCFDFCTKLRKKLMFTIKKNLKKSDLFY